MQASPHPTEQHISSRGHLLDGQVGQVPGIPTRTGNLLAGHRLSKSGNKSLR